MLAKRVPVNDWHSNITDDPVCEVSLQQLCTARMPVVSIFLQNLTAPICTLKA